MALVAGLIVALGIVGLSKEATRTFHEESRSSAAEATLRTAVDRLRADLSRAGYMSTPNIMADPKIAHAPGDPNNVQNISATMVGIRRLAGVHLFAGGSNKATLSANQTPALTPDAIEIGGNMTSAEQFEVESVQKVASCTRIVLSATSPAIYRVAAVGAAAESAELNNIFQPYSGHQFIVRLVDDTGRSQFLATCPGAATAGFATATQPFVDVDDTVTPVLTAEVTKTLGGVPGTPSGRAIVNPVQVVRWEILDSASEPAQYRNALDHQSLSPGTLDADKYDLVRSFVDALGQVVPETTEVVAEYAVDLDFAFSVESGTSAAPVTLTFPFDDPRNQTWADDVSNTPTATNRPQRIRSVRTRVATRAAQADRATTITAKDYGDGTKFLYRYCLVPPCSVPPAADGVLRFARMRTLTTDVRVTNQSMAFYP